MLGNIENELKIDNYQKNQEIKTKDKITEVNNLTLKNVNEKDEEVKKRNEDNKLEYKITNAKFSFDDETNTFVVKIKNKYLDLQLPSEDFLKLKIFLENK